MRASLEYEIRRAELDELAMADRSKEIDALGEQLAAFMQLQVKLPDESAFDLLTLRTILQMSIAQLEKDVVRSKETFLSSLNFRVTFLNPERVELVEQQTINAECLVLPSDTSRSPYINGAVQKGNNDIIYFTDTNNCSKIRSLDLKTRQIAEVHNKCPII